LNEFGGGAAALMSAAAAPLEETTLATQQHWQPQGAAADWWQTCVCQPPGSLECPCSSGKSRRFAAQIWHSGYL